MSSTMVAALRRVAVQPHVPAWRTATMQRGMGSAAGAGSSSGKSKLDVIKDHWLGDKGAWPVLAVIAGALVFSFSYMTYTLTTHPDVRISKDSRTAIIRKAKNSE